MTHSAIALTGFIAWTLFLLIVMEVVRAWLVVSKQVAVPSITPDNANLSPFMQRLARVHANCLEGLPIFGGLLLVAMVTEQTAITDPLACVLLVARVVQSSVHLVSVSVPAVNIRFAAFTVQMGIAAYWAAQLLMPLAG